MFEVALPAEGGDANLLDSFKKWVVDNAAAIGFAPGLNVSNLDGLVVSAIGSSRSDAPRAFTFEQTHDGVPVDGPARWVRLRVAGDKRVLAWEGEIVDGLRWNVGRKRCKV